MTWVNGRIAASVGTADSYVSFPILYLFIFRKTLVAKIRIIFSDQEITTKDVAAKWVILKLPERFPPLLTTAKEAYLGNLSDEWETVEKEAMALVEYMKKQIEELLRTE